MIQYLNVFFYDIYPYICATVFFLGSWLRFHPPGSCLERAV